jgi:hypothetical protein
VFLLTFQLARREIFPAPEDIAAEIEAGLHKQGPHAHIMWGDEDVSDVPAPRQMMNSPVYSPTDERPGSINSDGAGTSNRVVHSAYASPPFASVGSPRVAGGSHRVAGTGLLPSPLHSATSEYVPPSHAPGVLPPVHDGQHYHPHGGLLPAPAPHSISLAAHTAPGGASWRETSGGSGGGIQRMTSQASDRGHHLHPRPAVPPTSSGSAILQVSGRDLMQGADQQRLTRMGVVEASSLRNFDYSNLNRGGAVSPGDKVPSPTPEKDDSYS